MLKLLGDTLDTIKQLMGNSQSQFVAALKRGDTSAATQIYCSKKTLRESIKPNETLNGDLKENSILHYVASLSLYPVYEDMLNSGRAFPDQKNSDRRNCLHLICQGHKTGFEKDMLLLTFSRGLCGMDLKHVLSEQDSVSTSLSSKRVCTRSYVYVVIMYEWYVVLYCTCVLVYRRQLLFVCLYSTLCVSGG